MTCNHKWVSCGTFSVGSCDTGFYKWCKLCGALSINDTYSERIENPGNIGTYLPKKVDPIPELDGKPDEANWIEMCKKMEVFEQYIKDTKIFHEELAASFDKKIAEIQRNIYSEVEVFESINNLKDSISKINIKLDEIECIDSDMERLESILGVDEGAIPGEIFSIQKHLLNLAQRVQNLEMGNNKKACELNTCTINHPSKRDPATSGVIYEESGIVSKDAWDSLGNLKARSHPLISPDDAEMLNSEPIKHWMDNPYEKEIHTYYVYNGTLSKIEEYFVGTIYDAVEKFKIYTRGKNQLYSLMKYISL